MKTTVVLPDKTQLVAHFDVAVSQDGTVKAGYQKELEDVDKSEEVALGDAVSLTLDDKQTQAIIDAVTPVMNDIIAANESAAATGATGSSASAG